MTRVKAAAISLLVSCFVLAMTGAARASAINDCIDACFNSAGCSFHPDEDSNICQSGRDRCVQQCNDNINGRDDDKPQRTAGAFGAIAYDKTTGAWGLAAASQNKDDAEKSALGFCQKKGKDCEIVESVSRTCVAVAAGAGNRFGWSVSDSPKQAGLDAIAKCGESKDKNDKSRCFLQMYECYAP